MKTGAAICDLTTGLFGLSAVLAALYARGDHPEGQHVEISMLEASLNLMCNYVPSVASLGKTVPRLGHAHAQIVPYQGFECRDGGYIMIGAFSRKFWISLCGAVDHPEWQEDPRFRSNAARLANKAALIGLLEPIFLSRPREEWERILTKADVPNSPIYSLGDVLKTDHVRQHDIVREMGSDRKLGVVGFPIRSAAWSEDRFGTPAPRLACDTADVLRNVLQIDEPALRELAEKKIIEIN